MICHYVLDGALCFMCWIGLWALDGLGLKFGLFVIAKFQKFRETYDSGWFCGRVGICGAVGVVSTLL